jgi:tRNA(fMet)-specific endonuclease VapC
MRKYSLDTGIASDYIHRRSGVYEFARAIVKRGAAIGICVPVLGELWSGVELSATRHRNETELRQGLVDLKIWPYTDAAAHEFGRIFADLKRRGRPIQQIDVQIAAIARTLPDCTLVNKDSDFQAVSGLKIEDWTQAAAE